MLQFSFHVFQLHEHKIITQDSSTFFEVIYSYEAYLQLNISNIYEYTWLYDLCNFSY